MISVKPLSDALAAEVSGVDLTAPIDPETLSEVHKAWNDHLIVLFRDQDISVEDQTRFCRYFGELEVVRSVPSQVAEQPHVLFVTNVTDGNLRTVLEEGEMQFHIDQCYYELPCKATTLYAMEIPEEGGNTLFANSYAAYETLSDDVKTRIEGKKARNVYDYSSNPTRRGEDINPDAPQWVHPIVRRHPETGRKALFVNRLMTVGIEGMEKDEAQTLLEILFDHQEQKKFVFEHRWRPGDLLMWDNRCTLHARRDFDPQARRKLRRITIKGDPLS